MGYRFHMLTPPHTIANDDYVACAYAQKSRKLTTMLKSLGHTVFFYGHEHSVVDADELVAVTTQYDLDVAYPNFDFRRETFRFDTGDHCYRTYFANAIGEIWKRKQPNDFILATWGSGNKPVCDAHPDLISVEPGAGYAGGYFARWKIFESYSLLAAYQGLTAVGEAGHSGNYDVVIPNFFNVKQFDYQPVKQDYFLFIGRLGTGKGLHIVIQIAEKLGFRLIVAGQGQLSDAGYGGNGQSPVPSNVEFVGYADVEKRRHLMANAKGVFVLSQFNEPFGGVQIEAMLSGTPIITSDWGVFPETNLHGITGYRCRTFADMLWAVRNIDRISPAACRQWAEANYSMERVALMYDRYFHDVMDVYTGAGWYEPHDDRTDLDWMRRRYPDAPPAKATSFVHVEGGPQWTKEEGWHFGQKPSAPVIERSDLGGNVPSGDPCSWSPALWAALVVQFDVKSVLDVGCGEGHAVKWFRDAGIRALGFDGLPENKARAVTPIECADLTQCSFIYPVDLVICTEVVEHIDEAHLEKLLATLCNGRIIAMTHALPGQAGHHHVNCQPPEYWIRHITARGYEALDPEPFRKIAREENERSWFARSGLVFRRIETT